MLFSTVYLCASLFVPDAYTLMLEVCWLLLFGIYDAERFTNVSCMREATLERIIAVRTTVFQRLLNITTSCRVERLSS